MLHGLKAGHKLLGIHLLFPCLRGSGVFSLYSVLGCSHPGPDRRIVQFLRVVGDLRDALCGIPGIIRILLIHSQDIGAVKTTVHEVIIFLLPAPVFKGPLSAESSVRAHIEDSVLTAAGYFHGLTVHEHIDVKDSSDPVILRILRSHQKHCAAPVHIQETVSGILGILHAVDQRVHGKFALSFFRVLSPAVGNLQFGINLCDFLVVVYSVGRRASHDQPALALRFLFSLHAEYGPHSLIGADIINIRLLILIKYGRRKILGFDLAFIPALGFEIVFYEFGIKLPAASGIKLVSRQEQLVVCHPADLGFGDIISIGIGQQIDAVHGLGFMFFLRPLILFLRGCRRCQTARRNGQYNYSRDQPDFPSVHTQSSSCRDRSPGFG